MWFDALLISTYLLSRFTISPLSGEVPLHRLHPDHDHFVLPPQVFGCVAFVRDHTPNTSKLAPHFVKGVFVGYLCMQKGYQVYFIEQCKYVVFVDVIFFESAQYLHL